MKKIFVILFLLVSFVAFGQVADSMLEVDGHHWNMMDDEFQLATVFGYVLAMSNVGALADYLLYVREEDPNTLGYFSRLASLDYTVSEIKRKVNNWYENNSLEQSLWSVIQTVANADPNYVLTGNRKAMFDWMD